MRLFEDKDPYIRHLQMEYAMVVGAFCAVLAIVFVAAALFL